MFVIPNELIELSLLFENNPLYIVGGWVRDSLLNNQNLQKKDIDIASNLDIEKIRDVLQNKGFLLSAKNIKFGAYLISKNGYDFEYTRLRSESYKTPGKHSPDKVIFVDDIKIDAKRRDFTINSIYYSISDDKVFDFYGGVQDIKSKTIRCIETPEFVFTNDALRILRLVRFACTLNFEIDNKTLQAARKNVHKLSLISDLWKEKELQQIFNNKEFAISEDAKKRALNIFADLGALPYLLPQLKKFVIIKTEQY